MFEFFAPKTTSIFFRFGLSKNSNWKGINIFGGKIQILTERSKSMLQKYLLKVNDLATDTFFSPGLLDLHACLQGESHEQEHVEQWSV